MNHQVSNRCRLGNVARVLVPVLIDPTASNDGDGKPLDSANKYVMHYALNDTYKTAPIKRVQ